MSDISQTHVANSFLLLKAQGLARHGRIKEAQSVLAAEGTIPEDPVVLQALAALVTGQGDYSRALRLWELLLKREPGHAEAKRMVHALDLWISRPAWYRAIPYGGGALLALVSAWLLMWALSDSPPQSATRPASSASPVVATPASAVHSAPTRPQSVPAVSFPAPQPNTTRTNNKRR